MPVSIILAHPEISHNVGFVARTMKCYHLPSLRIVGRKYPRHSYAYKTGCSAVDILDNTGYFKTLEGALADCHLALGFTRRRRDELFGYTENMLEVIPSIDFSQHVALVFGRESQGLSKEECLLADKLVQINLPNNDQSLNISHAVAIVLHEIFAHGLVTDNPLIQKNKQKQNKKKASKKTAVAATFHQKSEALESFMEILQQKNVLKTSKAGAHANYIKNLWLRANPNQKEIEFLLGLIHKITK
ncbi:MAG: RNA methyltransferase [Fibrobacteria bacterium]|nr:RNA methyltransferase [Fibrobacteria bacterium]